MANNEKNVKPTEEIKNVAAENATEIIKFTLDYLKDYVINRIPGWTDAAIQNFKNLLNNPDTPKEIELEWSKQLYEKGMIVEAEVGLPDDLLVHNFHQEGYTSGLYAGYAIAMMALVDNDAPEELIQAVRDEMRPNLIGHAYEKSSEFSDRYKDKKYDWVEKLSKDD